jgi:hypothetical protein
MGRVRDLVLVVLACGVLTVAALAAEPVAEAWPKLLVKGMVPGGEGAVNAKQAHAVLKKDKQVQARADYGLGLVFVQHGKYREAQSAFAAARQAQLLLPGAWEGEIWCRLVAKDLKGAYPLIEAYARIMANEMVQLSPETRTAAVTWLGSTLAALEQTLDVAKAKEVHAAQTQLVAAILGEQHRAAYEAGRALVSPADDVNVAAGTPAEAGEAAKPADAPEAPQEAVKPEPAGGDGAGKPQGVLKAKREKEEAERVERSQKKSEQAREGVKRSVEQWKFWYDDNIAKSNTALNDLVRSASGIQSRMVAVQNEYLQVKQQEARLAALKPKPGSSAHAELTNLGARSGALAGEGQQLTIDLANVRRQGAVALQQRTAIVQTYEQATGQLVKQDANLQRIQGKLAEKSGEADKPGAAKGAKSPTTAKTGGKKAKLLAFKDVAAFDVEGRRNALLTSLGLPVPPPAPKP